MTNERLDVVGYWTEMKLQILQEYAKAYSRVLNCQKSIKHLAYIDGFAGAGAHISKGSGEVIHGSPARALSVKPRFTHYHFVEMDAVRAERLRGIGDQKDVSVYHGDEEKAPNESVIASYRKRLKEVANFKYVPEPLPMRNTRGAVVYYLFFASQNHVGNKIAEHIFSKYRLAR